MRWTACKDPLVRARPVGTIDPLLKMISFWDGPVPVAALTYYATHPQSYYRTGLANPDFPGMAPILVSRPQVSHTSTSMEPAATSARANGTTGRPRIARFWPTGSPPEWHGRGPRPSRHRSRQPTWRGSRWASPCRRPFIWTPRSWKRSSVTARSQLASGRRRRPSWCGYVDASPVTRLTSPACTWARARAAHARRAIRRVPARRPEASP